MSAHVQIDDTRVDLLIDGTFEAPRDRLGPRARGGAALAGASARWGDRLFRGDVNCFLLRGSSGVETVDADPARAAATRRAILRTTADRGWIAGGGHIRGFVRCEPEGPGFRPAAA